MNLLEIWSIWIAKLADLSLTLIGIGIGIGELYLAYRIIKYFVRYHAEYQNELAERREQKQRSQRKMDEINRELDEIEATLNAVSEAENSDGKITPIWNSKPPKQ